MRATLTALITVVMMVISAGGAGAQDSGIDYTSYGPGMADLSDYALEQITEVDPFTGLTYYDFSIPRPGEGAIVISTDDNEAFFYLFPYVIVDEGGKAVMRMRLGWGSKGDPLIADTVYFLIDKRDRYRVDLPGDDLSCWRGDDPKFEDASLCEIDLPADLDLLAAIARSGVGAISVRTPQSRYFALKIVKNRQDITVDYKAIGSGEEMPRIVGIMVA